MKKQMLILAFLSLSLVYTFACPPALRGYFMKDDTLYFGYYRSTDAIKVPHIDTASFKMLESTLYALDKSGVYYEGRKVIGANPSTFEFLGGISTISDPDGYSKDGKSVFFADKRLKIADVKTFEVIPPYYNAASKYQDGYAKDKKYVFCYGQLMIDYDSPTFEVLGWHYTKDKWGIYYYNSLIPNSNTKEYKHNKGYLVTGGKVYLDGVRMKMYDAPSFDVLFFNIEPLTSCGEYGLSCFVTKDENGIYLNNKKQHNIDLDSFETIDRLNFKDKHCLYTISLPTYTDEACITKSYWARKIESHKTPRNTSRRFKKKEA